MVKKNNLIFISFLLCLGVVFGGCSLVAQPANMETESPNKTIQGKISLGNSGIYSITDDKGVITELDARKVDLSKYVGKIAIVVGQFSGTTLFVDSVE